MRIRTRCTSFGPVSSCETPAACPDALQQQAPPLTPSSHPHPQANADAKFADYQPKVAFFFPGQGAQTVGMAKEAAEAVPAAKQLFERASDILGYDLLAVCAEGEGSWHMRIRGGCLGPTLPMACTAGQRAGVERHSEAVCDASWDAKWGQ